MTQFRPTKRSLWFTGVLILLMLSVILARVYRHPLLHMIIGELPATQISPPPCDLNQQACRLPIITPVASEAPWTFAITPRPVPVSTPLSFTLTPPERVLSNNQPTAVWVDLSGDSMDMGLIRVPLVRTEDGRWQGNGSIPVCVTGKMRWRARLNLQLEQTVLEADWLFDAPTEPHTTSPH